jgi:hypothetical protein
MMALMEGKAVEFFARQAAPHLVEPDGSCITLIIKRYDGTDTFLVVKTPDHPDPPVA